MTDSPSVKRARTDGKVAKIVVAGAGWWSQIRHLPQLTANPRAEVSAIIEPCEHPRSTLEKNMKSTKELAELYKCKVFANIDEFLVSGIKADGIIVCTSHATHADIGLKCLKAGLHVLMEKPMTTDADEAVELCKAVRASGRHFMINNTAKLQRPGQASS